MIRRSIIVLEYETREKMKQVARKNQTYDDLIQELLKLKEQEQEQEQGGGGIHKG